MSSAKKADLAGLVAALQAQGLLGELAALLPAAPVKPEEPKFSVLEPSGNYKLALVSCEIPGCKRQALSPRFLRALMAHSKQVIAMCDKAEAVKPAN